MAALRLLDVPQVMTKKHHGKMPHRSRCPSARSILGARAWDAGEWGVCSHPPRPYLPTFASRAADTHRSEAAVSDFRVCPYPVHRPLPGTRERGFTLSLYTKLFDADTSFLDIEFQSPCSFLFLCTYLRAIITLLLRPPLPRSAHTLPQVKQLSAWQTPSRRATERRSPPHNAAQPSRWAGTDA